MPGEYIYKDYNIVREEAYSITKYLLDKYNRYINMKLPVIDISLDYDNYGTYRFKHEAYEDGASLLDKILEYNFNRVGFWFFEDGLLSGIARHNIDLTKKIGDYPIINAEEAYNLLINGHYVTSYYHGLPGAEYVARVQLVYLNGPLDPVFMPYYAFLVELPEEEEVDGLKAFGLFYVPAVESEYLEGMPLWDGSINR